MNYLASMSKNLSKLHDNILTSYHYQIVVLEIDFQLYLLKIE